MNKYERIFERLSLASRDGIAGYNREYQKNIREIFTLVLNQGLLKAQIRTDAIASSESMLRFSLVFNDLSLLTCSGGKELSMILLEQKWFRDQFGMDGSISITQNRMLELGVNPNNPLVQPGFIFPLGDEYDQLIEKLRSFIESGKLLIQPARMVLVSKEELDKEGRKVWQAVDASLFTPLDQWEMIEEAGSRPISLSYQTNDHLNHDALFEITLPYLEGVQFCDLAKILEDESDLVSGLRASIKSVVETSGKGVSTKEMARDVIDPKVHLLNRKLNSLVNTHSFRVGGAAVGTVVLAYTAVMNSGLSSAIATVCGTGGLGLLGNEYSSYKEKINSLKEDPHYFLWRCKKLSEKH